MNNNNLEQKKSLITFTKAIINEVIESVIITVVSKFIVSSIN
jgi:hypothetical protein